MKKLVLIFTLIINTIVFSQDDKTVTLVVSGQGKTQEEAKQNALRSAIEQAFGTFISSKTEILNDNLVKDEIVSISNGNIQKFDIISEVQIPDGGYATTLKAIVSVTRLTSFIQSKGLEVEFKGELFSFNINQQKLNESNEKIAMKNIIDVTVDILKKSFYGTIKASDPIYCDEENYMLPLEIEIKANKNVNIAMNYFLSNVKNLGMTKEELNNYDKLKKPVCELILVSSSKLINGTFSFGKLVINSLNTVNKKISIEEFQDDDLRFERVYIPDYDPSDYNNESIYLRNEESLGMIGYFLENVIKSIIDFKILSDKNLNLSLNFQYNQKTKKFDGIKPILVGSIPVWVNGKSKLENLNLPFGKHEINIIIPQTEYLNIGGYGGVRDFNKKLAKYKESSPKGNIKYKIDLIIHRYENEGQVYKIIGSSKLNLDMIKSISNLKIQYNK